MFIKIFVLVLLYQFAKGARIDPAPEHTSVTDQDTEELVSIAQQIREHPLVIDKFKPSVSIKIMTEQAFK